MKNIKRNFIALASLMFIQLTAFAQQNADEQMNKMLDYSRPGENHILLSRLAGTWRFQDAKLSFVNGTLVRKSIYDGRFFVVEITGGKLPLPIANGKSKVDNYRGMQIEGYDNGRMKFVASSINNHIGSDIQSQTGNYDAAKKEFIYEWDDELIKGQRTTNRRVVKLIDDTHYIELYYEKQAGQFVKTRELDYTKSSD